jgi:dihydrofolate reductase
MVDKGGTMGKVIMHAVVSVDGFIADDHDDVGPLFDWYFNGDVPLDFMGMRLSAASFDYTRPLWDSIGATVMGRRLFDQTNGWEAHPPAGEHLVVVSHRPKPDGWHPEADVPFFDNVEDAVAEARRRAGDRAVAVTAGNMGGHALAAGLVDEVAMDVVPVVFGSGRRYFGDVDGQVMLADPQVVVPGKRVLHLRYPVAR